MARLPKKATDSKKEKLGTTVLESTVKGLKGLQEKFPGEVRSVGEAIDLVCGLMLDMEPVVAEELMNFCAERAEKYTEEVGRFSVAEVGSYSFAEKSRIQATYSGFANYFRVFGGTSEVKVSGMKRINLKNGDYFVCPTDWPILNESEAMDCGSVTVIEIHGGSKYNAPHFAYLRRDDGWMTEGEKATALSLAESVWPDMEKVLQDEVPLVYDSEGKPLNAEEHLSAPIVCFFNVSDAADSRDPGDAPYGAMVFRS